MAGFFASRFSKESTTCSNILSNSAWFFISAIKSSQYFLLFLEFKTTVFAIVGLFFGAGPGFGSRNRSFLHSSEGILKDWHRMFPCLSQGPYLPVWVDLLRVLFIGWAKSRTLRLSSNMLEAALLFTSNFWRCEAKEGWRSCVPQSLIVLGTQVPVSIIEAAKEQKKNLLGKLNNNRGGII